MKYICTPYSRGRLVQLSPPGDEGLRPLVMQRKRPAAVINRTNPCIFWWRVQFRQGCSNPRLVQSLLVASIAAHMPKYWRHHITDDRKWLEEAPSKSDCRCCVELEMAPALTSGECSITLHWRVCALQMLVSLVSSKTLYVSDRPPKEALRTEYHFDTDFTIPEQ